MRFKKIALGIQMFQQHNEQASSEWTHRAKVEAVEKARNDAGNEAATTMKMVLASLDEYYKELNDAGWELNDMPSVPEDVNPNWDYEQEDRALHHFVIMKEFLKHLRFSSEVVQNFNENEVKAHLQQEQQQGQGAMGVAAAAVVGANN